MEWNYIQYPLWHSSSVFASHKISFQMKPVKMEEPKSPDNNRITSCRRLDVFPSNLDLNFLPPALMLVRLSFRLLGLLDDSVFNQRW